MTQLDRELQWGYNRTSPDNLPRMGSLTTVTGEVLSRSPLYPESLGPEVPLQNEELP